MDSDSDEVSILVRSVGSSENTPFIGSPPKPLKPPPRALPVGIVYNCLYSGNKQRYKYVNRLTKAKRGYVCVQPLVVTMVVVVVVNIKCYK